MHPLVGRSLGLSGRSEDVSFLLPNDRTRLLFFGQIPAGFGIRYEQLKSQEGMVLFSIDLPLTEEQQAAMEAATAEAEAEFVDDEDAMDVVEDLEDIADDDEDEDEDEQAESPLAEEELE